MQSMLPKTFIKKDVEIELLDNHEFAKTVEMKATQTKCTKSTQEGIHSSANGSSSQNYH